MNHSSVYEAEMQRYREAATNPEHFTPTEPWVPLSARQKRVRVQLSGATPLLAVPTYVGAMRSKPVQTAYVALEELVEQANAAAASVLHIKQDEAAEQGEAIAAALASGDSGTAARRDWVSELALREAKYADLHAKAAEAQRHLLAIARNELPKRLPELVTDAAQAREAASEALTAAEHAVAVAVELTQLIREVDRVEAIQPPTWWQSRHLPLEPGAVAGLRAARLWLDECTRDRVLSGEYVLESDSDTVPTETVQALRASDRTPAWHGLLGILAVQSPGR